MQRRFHIIDIVIATVCVGMGLGIGRLMATRYDPLKPELFVFEYFLIGVAAAVGAIWLRWRSLGLR